MTWVAELSNGERVIEPEVEIKDELSPWHLLLERCRRDNLRIMQLHLHKARVRVSGIPGAVGYAALYEIRTSMRGAKPNLLQGIASIIPVSASDLFAFINWIDDSGQVTQEVRPYAPVHVHSTLQERRDLL